MSTIHATCVAFDALGVLLRGPSGVGKSDLALRLIDGGATLVSDDYTIIEQHGTQLLASAPESIRGLLEVRGIGIMRMPTRPGAIVSLIVDLVPPASIPRLPEPETVTIEGTGGIPIRRVMIAPFEESAVAKIRLALRPPIPQDRLP